MYTEPLSKKLQLQFGYGLNLNKSLSDKNTYNFNEATGRYDDLDSAFTNKFSTTITSHSPSLSLNLKFSKLTLNAGATTFLTRLEHIGYTTSTTLSQRQVNYSPTMHLQYQARKNKNLSFIFNAHTHQPTIRQLQPVPDNSNPLYIQIGNPDLKPVFTLYYQLNYQTFGLETGNSLFASITFNPTRNNIIQSVHYDQYGRQVSHYMNVDGVYNLNGYFSFSKSKTTGEHRLRFTTGASLSFNKNTSYLLSWNQVEYSQGSTGETDFARHQLSAAITLSWPRHFMLESDLAYQHNGGIPAGFRRGAVLWNLGISHRFLKQQQGELKLWVYDLLKQNLNLV